MIQLKDQTLSGDYGRAWVRQKNRVHNRLIKIGQSAWLYQIIRISLGLFFFYSGVSKLVNPKAFALVIEAYGLIPDFMNMPVAISLPSLEVIAALGLLKEVRGSLSIITGLIILFMGILGYGIYLGLDIDCGCFGPGDPEGDAYHSLQGALYKNLLLMVGIIYLFMWRYIRINRKDSLKYWLLKII